MIWRRASAQQSVLSLLLSPPSSLLPLPSSKKKEETFYYRNISGEEFFFYYSSKIIPKNRRRVNLQSLQFYINSKTIGLQRVKTVIISAQMVPPSFFCVVVLSPPHFFGVVICLCLFSFCFLCSLFVEILIPSGPPCPPNQP